MKDFYEIEDGDITGALLQSLMLAKTVASARRFEALEERIDNAMHVIKEHNEYT